MRENKIFSIFPLFYPLFIFYPPTFPSSQPNAPLGILQLFKQSRTAEQTSSLIKDQKDW